MIVAKAIEVTPERLVSSNVPEDDADAWVQKSYALGDEVVKDGHLWSSATAANTNIPGEERLLPFKWVDKGPINKWRMFDKKQGLNWQIGTFTSNPDEIIVEFQSAEVLNAIGIVGVSAASIRIEIEVPGVGNIYDETYEMADYGVDNWYDYFFAPIEREDSLAILDIAPYSNSLVKLTFSSPGSLVEVGTVVFGYQEELGVALFGTSIDYESYSVQNVDRWGNMSIIPGGFRDVINYDLELDTRRTGYLRRRIRELRDYQSLYVGDVDTEVSIMIGVSSEFSLVLENSEISTAVLKVRSLQ